MTAPGFPKAALFYAAGLGTRMAPLTDTRPKPLVEVAGKPLIDHALALVGDAGLERIAVNTHYLGEQIHAHLKDRNVLISDESDQLLETGGGLLNALPLLQSDPVMTFNTDAVWTGGSPTRTLLDHWNPETMEALLLLVKKAAAVGHNGAGDFEVDERGRIQPGPGHIYTGVQIIRTDRLISFAEGAFSIWDLWRGMLERGTMYGVLHDGGWCDVGRPESIPLAEEMLGFTSD